MLVSKLFHGCFSTVDKFLVTANPFDFSYVFLWSSHSEKLGWRITGSKRFAQLSKQSLVKMMGSESYQCRLRLDNWRHGLAPMRAAASIKALPAKVYIDFVY